MSSTEWIDKLKVAELKDELKKYSLPVSGKKAELAERLRAHLENGEDEQIEQEEAAAEIPEEEPIPIPTATAATEARKEASPPPAAPVAAAPPAAEPVIELMETEQEQLPESDDDDDDDDKEESNAAANGFGLAPVLHPFGNDATAAADAVAMEVDEEIVQTERTVAPITAAAAAAAAATAPKEKKKGRPGQTLTMADISKDSLTRLAEETWSGAALTSEIARAFDAALVETIYNQELGGGKQEPPPRRVALLELSQYLENYLWRGYRPESATPVHILSIVLMVNEKSSEGMPGWDCFEARPNDFSEFFSSLLTLPDRHSLTHCERLAYLSFFSNAFQSLENEMVRGKVLKLVGLPLWHALSRGRLQLELHEHPQLAKHWKHLAKKEAKAKAASKTASTPSSSSFLPRLLNDFLSRLTAAVSPDGATVDLAAVHYCEHFVHFLSSLLSQLPTRRFVHAVIEDKAVLVKCRLSALHQHPTVGALFSQLVEALRAVLCFPIDDHTGDALSEDAVTAKHYEKIQQLQRLLFKHWPSLQEAALANCGTLEKREILTKFLSQLTAEELRLLVTSQLRLVDGGDPSAADPLFLTEVMVTAYERRRPQRETIESMPLYPTEELLLNGDTVPGNTINSLNNNEEASIVGAGGGSSSGSLALPRLNLQFLTLNDYLVRNFYLFRLEAAYEVREDVAEVIKRTAPHLGDDNAVHFSGWSRMAQPLAKFGIVEVRKPQLGGTAPAAATAEVCIDVRNMRPDVRAEWDSLKQHDVLFLLSVQPGYENDAHQRSVDWKGATDVALRCAGLQYVRGCEVLEVRDQEGKLMNDFSGRVAMDERGPPRGTLRTLTVALDPTQYQADVTSTNTSTKNVYSSFSLVMRRNAKENNFKSVLESIRDLVADEAATAAIPAWLHDVILGYGDPADAQYPAMDEVCLHTVDFKDTFLDADHLSECFPGYQVEFKPAQGETQPHPPFRVTFPSFEPLEEGAAAPIAGAAAASGKRKAAGEEEPITANKASSLRLLAESYSPADPGPYPQDAPPLNKVRFTPVQTQAVLSGVQPGLTMVVGPPGTGKTDTAVQIMHILYHNCPSQRTLIITHSNQALNDLFQKLVERDVPSRYLLRLGMGESDLDTEETFSRVGRVNAMLARRMELLAEVERLAKSLKISDAVSYTCETAEHFWLLHVLARWEKFSAAVRAQKKTAACVGELFPFKEYFSDTPAVLFSGVDFSADWSRAEGCFRHLRNVFQELKEIRPFEVLKTQGDRINYLLTKQAKIVAMTCTHAALKRKEFLALGFTFDNLLMEEAAQVLEIETALPMLLQRAQDDGQSRLKRVVIIGDHHQLPPVVKNTALQKVSKMDQSLFSRFIRLGAPYIELNAQGRARPSLAALYNWRYKGLGDLAHVATLPTFISCNPGFAFEYQLIDVPDFLGRGESEPVPHFYQNLGEAEYLVSVYQYMRLLGYPAASISILTTYNGQRALLQDVVERRCASHPLFGRPRTVSTVDKYQGQQNEYVLLSLVRSRHFGHLRDVRRLVVAMSRARLGLYVFARGGLFANCYELQSTFRQLLGRPTQLALVAGEQFNSSSGSSNGGAGATRRVDQVPADALLVQGVEHMASIVQQMGNDWEQQVGGGGEMLVEEEVIG